MGITIGYLLSQEFFKDFTVIAGKRGLNREIQGVTVWDAPDSTNWTLGKELILTNGYVISKDKNCIQNLKIGFGKSHAALIIKLERYLTTIPTELIDLFESHNVPLITMPYSNSWMEVINQVNVAVMNHAIQQLCINVQSKFNTSNRNYKDQKIQRILQTVENEMEFPAVLYDVFENKAYYSSPNFKKTSEQYGMVDEDYWNPVSLHTTHTLCDCIHMVRYRLINKNEAIDEPRISWIVIPILLDGVPQAYFCVMESRRFVDFYDEYFMRFTFMLLLSIYEQISVARDASNIGFENFIHMALEAKDQDYNKLAYQANQVGISFDQQYLCILLRHNHDTYDIRSRRNEMIDMFHQCTIDRSGRLAFLSREEGMILLDIKKLPYTEKSYIYALLEEYHAKLQKKFDGITWTFSFANEGRALSSLRETLQKCRKIMRIGRIACPDQKILDYDHLGILTWLDIPDDELKKLLGQFRQLMQAEKNKELLQTLRVYLENNMNYSMTADKLFVNINTIRRRIEKINELIDVDWSDYLERIKIELMLQFLQ